ncbi:MAG: DNA repair protein RecO [Syntrophaceae bacterium PtaU1.Bin231]|nr:MAG: DNA repair protein RecO [Syntrophaceae bacterium PtaU1.Bin231]
MGVQKGIKTDAFVLRFVDYGESDRIVTFFSSDFGKLKGIAKGARRSRKRFANALEPFTRNRILFSRKSQGQLALIEGADVLDHYAGIRADLERTLTASYFIDLTDGFTAEGKQLPELFALLSEFLGLIDSGRFKPPMLRFFELRLLKIAGFEPVLDRCTSCSQPLESSTAYRFYPADGGLRCARCVAGGTQGFPVSPGTARSLLIGRAADIRMLGRIALTEQSDRESRRLLAAFIRHILGREPKSFRILEEIVRPWGSASGFSD